MSPARLAGGVSDSPSPLSAPVPRQQRRRHHHGPAQQPPGGRQRLIGVGVGRPLHEVDELEEPEVVAQRGGRGAGHDLQRHNRIGGALAQRRPLVAGDDGRGRAAEPFLDRALHASHRELRHLRHVGAQRPELRPERQRGHIGGEGGRRDEGGHAFVHARAAVRLGQHGRQLRAKRRQLEREVAQDGLSGLLRGTEKDEAEHFLHEGVTPLFEARPVGAARPCGESVAWLGPCAKGGIALLPAGRDAAKRTVFGALTAGWNGATRHANRTAGAGRGWLTANRVWRTMRGEEGVAETAYQPITPVNIVTLYTDTAAAGCRGCGCGPATRRGASLLCAGHAPYAPENLRRSA